ncbi:MAG: acyltransferase domain-containing protein, partial [Clostridium sp.]
MKIDEFCEGIGLGADEAQLIYNNILPRDKFEGYDNIFKTDKEQFFCRLQAEENTEEIALIFYVMKSVELYSKFCESRISKEIYFDTFSDITIWSNRYKKNTGKLGLR